MKAKAIAGLITILFLASIMAIPVHAIKPRAEFVPWNLSADVMLVPPYGSMDIPGSDTASKLILNQPNGEVEVVLTGAMNGLNPNMVYTVYLSRGYTLTFERWSLLGDWKHVGYLGTNEYRHDWIVIAETDITFSGTGGYPAGEPHTITWSFTGTKAGDGTIIMHIDYDGSPYWADLFGTIDSSDGSISGSWIDSNGKSGTWETYEGQAQDQGKVGTGWSGLFTSTIPPFTFTTDGDGSGSWHLNMRDSDFPGPGTYWLSVWINEAGATMLISDNFQVIVS